MFTFSGICSLSIFLQLKKILKKLYKLKLVKFKLANLLQVNA